MFKFCPRHIHHAVMYASALPIVSSGIKDDMLGDYTKDNKMEKPECPRCKKTGKVKAKGSGATITCPLCKGLGEIPPLHAVVENETSLALYYWECKCEIKKYGMTLLYVHPSNHEACEKCGAKAKDAPLSPAGYAQAFYSILYDLDMDIEYPPDNPE